MGDPARGDAGPAGASGGGKSGEPVTPNLRLDPLGAGDNARLRGWLQLAGVLAWWGSRDRAEAEVALAVASPSAICRIICVGGEPIGYAHAVDGALLDGGDGGPSDSGAWDCAVFIAVEAHRGMGRGEMALRALVAEVFGTTLAVACTLRVPVTKEHAVRAIEAAGFRWVRVQQDPALGRVWLMRCDRPQR